MTKAVEQNDAIFRMSELQQICTDLEVAPVPTRDEFHIWLFVSSTNSKNSPVEIVVAS